MIPNVISLEISNELYPESLKNIYGCNAPSPLYLRGNISLLKKPGIGFCGSRKSSDKGIEVTQDCASQAAENNIVVISGNAAGVDQEAHYNALRCGGSTILVLPEGINHFKIKSYLKPVWDWDRCLIISQFSPDDTWKVYRAMARNKLIIALSEAMILIEAGETGGTLNAGLETLKTNIPLYVVEYEDMSMIGKGNKELLDRGAKRLSKSRATGRANLKNTFSELKNRYEGKILLGKYIKHEVLK
ncbi:TPA: DNA-processing protein DprA [Legionella pneumophila]|nr:DNA-processing protein DprA [Legionella pneumophila]